MRRIFLGSCLIFFFVFVIKLATGQRMGINTNVPHASAALEVYAIDKGILIPRMTSAQRDLITSPAAGLLVYDINTSSFWFKSTVDWIELVDTMNNVWKKNGTNALLGVTGNVGIGTSAPLYDLHVSRNDPTIGFTDTEDGQFSGSITGDSTNLLIDAYRKHYLSSGQPGNLILQTGSGINTAGAGNVGIGIDIPQSKMHVNGDEKLNGEFILQDGGIDKALFGRSGNNIIIGTTDNNPFGSAAWGAKGDRRLLLEPFSSKQFGVETSGNFQPKLTINSIGEFNRPNKTGSADLIPICYGKVLHNGNILGGTGNFSATYMGTGTYQIAISGETGMYANQDNYTIIVSPFYKLLQGGESVRASASVSFRNNNTVEVIMRKFYLDHTSEDCTCGSGYPSDPQHYFTGAGYEEVDTGFSFMVFKK